MPVCRGTTSSLQGNIDLTNGALTFNQSTSGIYSGALLGAGGGVTKGGAGTVVFDGNSSGFSGAIQMTSGVRSAANANALGTGGAGVSSGGTLDADGVTTGNALTLSGSGAGGAGALVSTGTSGVSGNIILGGSSTSIGVAAPGDTMTIGGAIGDGGNGYSLTKTGAGTPVLSDTNTYSGGTAINGGTLRLSGSGMLGATSGALTVTSGTLDLGTTTQTQNGGLTLTGGTIQNGTLSSSSTFDLQAGYVNAMLAGTGAVETVQNLGGETQLGKGEVGRTGGPLTCAFCSPPRFWTVSSVRSGRFVRSGPMAQCRAGRGAGVCAERGQG